MSEKEIWDCLDDLKTEIKRDVTNVVRWYLGFSFGVIMLLGGFIGWTAKEAITTNKEVTTLKTDFGTMLLIAPDDHQESVLFEELIKKYNPSRGK